MPDADLSIRTADRSGSLRPGQGTARRDPLHLHDVPGHLPSARRGLGRLTPAWARGSGDLGERHPVNDTPDGSRPGPGVRLVRGLDAGDRREAGSRRAPPRPGSLQRRQCVPSPLILIGDDRAGAWRRVHGLSALEPVGSALDCVRRWSDEAPARSRTPGRPGLTGPSLLHRRFAARPARRDGAALQRPHPGQGGPSIHVFFASCKNTCPLMLATSRSCRTTSAIDWAGTFT